MTTTVAFTNDNINDHGGLHLIGDIINNVCNLPELFEPNSKQKPISDADILLSQVGLLSQGLTHYQDIELFRQNSNSSFKESLGIETIPSAETLRQRLTLLTGDAFLFELDNKISIPVLQACQHKLTPVEINGRQYLPNDIDVTPMNNEGSKRENVGCTYKKFEGFAPIISYLGREGFVLHHQLRPGTQHCQKNVLGFLDYNLTLLKKLSLKYPVLIRMDSGHDSVDTINTLRNSGHFFLVKRNIRREDKVKYLSHAMAQGVPECPREGKEIYIGTLEHLCPGGEKSEGRPLPCVYKITRRTIDKTGQELLLDDIDVELYWTNLPEGPESVIKLYHDHGTSEQYHSEIKSDLGLERFPSRPFGVNKLFLSLGLIAYNLLRMIDSLAREQKKAWPRRLKKKAKQTRIRVGGVIRDLICIAGKLVKHGRRTIFKVGEGWEWSRVVIAIGVNLRS